jgi:DNA-binding protein H-NS
MRSYEEIQAEIRKLQQEATELQEREAAIGRILDEMKRFGISAEELSGISTEKGSAASKATSPAKEVVAEKLTMTKAVSDESPAVKLLKDAGIDFSRRGAGAVKPPMRTKPAAKGKPAPPENLPPRYRNPKTGATWSGHARPPAWIKDARDRSVYLIDKTAATAASENGAADRSTPKAARASKSPAQKRPT